MLGTAAAITATPPFGHAMRSNFMLAEDLTTFNFGGYGGTPKPVFEAQMNYIRQMEADTGEWMNGATGYRGKISAVRVELAKLLKCSADDLVLVDNASNAINVLLARFGLTDSPFNATSPLTRRSSAPAVLLDLSVAYGPFVGYYNWLQAERGVEVMTVDLSFPSTDAQLVAAVREALELRKAAGLAMPAAAVVDQVASVPALKLPVAELTRVLHEYGVFVIVDGAHAVGNVPCDFSSSGELTNVDAWFGNAHKWLMAPKSAAVMYVRADHHSGAGEVGVWPEPTVVDSYGDDFVTRFVWSGTRDRSSFCAVHDALAFRASVGGEEAIREYTHGLARWAGEHLSAVWHTKVLDSGPSQANSMLNIVVPTANHTACLQVVHTLHASHGIYVNSCFQLDAEHGAIASYFRLSAQIFLQRSDFVKLGELVPKLLAEEAVRA